MDRKRHGLHYTPPALAAFVAERALAAAPDRPLRVLDPACGDGELLAAVAALAPDAVLTGYDVDETAVATAQRRLPNAAIAHKDFLESPPPERFDLVVTNPPYVRTQLLDGRAAELVKRFGLRGRVDLAHPFVAVAPSLLDDGGVLALLCSNRFLSTRAGENVRTVLTRDLTVREVFDLGDTRLFAAAVLPAVVVAVKGGASAPARYATAYTTDSPADGSDLFAALQAERDSVVAVQGRRFAVSVGTFDNWRLSTPDRDDRRSRIAERTWRTVGDVANIRVGIKTTADSVFIADWDTVEHRPEDELLRPLLCHGDLQAWTPPAPPTLRVLYPYLDRPSRQVVDLADYPRAAAYLAAHRERLEGRAYLRKAGRAWFEIWVPHRPARWREPKIVFPDISPEPRFTLDRTGAIVNGDCYWISVTDTGEDVAHLILGVANSSFGVRFYDEVCGNRLYAGRRRWITQYVSRLPLPDPESPAGRRVITAARALVAGEGDRAAVDEAVESAFRT
ncbi:Eco57I restriction-modification methylase domain-containing protein [Actinokineospora sp. UTMC 2448]|uniref:Eco57I restriction-modification methylase domain-containing protein n=1 Tax=Actinokineospora sp. UTMC 2448 TaxID=2268449 RepID=UPI0021644007|nr:methyltransferase [Actinokineospora sp. UTMC 2448]UVS76397.1 Modification methylase Eco57IB [Actinokineospora sp. UTMC 2448]